MAAQLPGSSGPHLEAGKLGRGQCRGSRGPRGRRSPAKRQARPGRVGAGVESGRTRAAQPTPSSQLFQPCPLEAKPQLQGATINALS